MPAVQRPLILCEYTLGHVTFCDGLERYAATQDDLDPTFVRLRPSDALALDRVPLLNRLSANYTLRLSMMARRALRTSTGDPGVVVVHTQSAAQLIRPGLVPRLVISIDGTPRNLDEVAAGYGHSVQSRPVERAKAAFTSGAFGRASHVISFNRWAAASAVNDYGVREERVSVVHPGIPIPRARPERSEGDGPLRLLFVGADFARKGGHELLAALAGLEGWQLDVVTKSEVPATAQVSVHSGLSPNSPELVALFARADLFVLPTHSDLFPLACIEAMAAGLPVITTTVGATSEIVVDGVTGLLIRPGDVPALRSAIESLHHDVDRRRSMGDAAYEVARREFDIDVQSRKFFDVLSSVAG